jgi:hypothetical protein
MFTLKTFELGPKQNFHYVLVDQDTMSTAQQPLIKIGLYAEREKNRKRYLCRV